MQFHVGFSKSPFHPPLQPSSPASWGISVPQWIAWCGFNILLQTHLEPAPAHTQLLPRLQDTGGSWGYNAQQLWQNPVLSLSLGFNVPLEHTSRLKHFRMFAAVASQPCGKSASSSDLLSPVKVSQDWVIAAQFSADTVIKCYLVQQVLLCTFLQKMPKM